MFFSFKSANWRIVQTILLVLVFNLLSADRVLADWLSDLTPPTCSISFNPASSADTGTPVTVTVSSTDSGGSGVVKTTLRKEGTEVLSQNSDSLTYNWITTNQTAKIYIFSATPKDKAGNEGFSCTGLFTLKSPLSVTCSPSKTTARTGESITWTAAPLGGTGSYTYNWTGTDGLSGNRQTASKSYSTSGSKYATISVTSGTQTKNFTCGPVQVANSLTASCSGNPTPAAISQGVNWNSTVSGGSGSYTYSWTGTDNKGGFTADLLNVYYSSSGTKAMELLVNSTDGQRSSTACQIVVQPPPPRFNQNKPAAICRIGRPAVQLSWTPSAGAEYYYYERYEWLWNGRNWVWGPPKRSLNIPSTVTNVTDWGDPFRDLKTNTDYGYYIYAHNQFGETRSNFQSTTTSNCAAGPFDIISATPACSAPNAGYVDLEWTRSENAAYYNIWRYDYTEKVWVNLGNKIELTIFRDLLVSPAARWYYYYIEAIARGGSTSANKQVLTKNCVIPTVDIKANDIDGPITVPTESSVVISGRVENAQSCTASTTLPSDNRFSRTYTQSIEPPFTLPDYRTPAVPYPAPAEGYEYRYTCTNNNIGKADNNPATDQVFIKTSGPDLIPLGLVVSNPSPLENQEVKFSSFVRNVGNAPAGISQARFCIDDPGCRSGSISNEIERVEALGVGQKSALLTSGTWIASMGINKGAHNAYFCVDSEQRINEEREDNNCTPPLPFTVNPPRQPFIETEGGDVHSNKEIRTSPGR